jgi:multidrug efflux pump subunit AcrA (membrane-fusion protein)
MATGAGSMIGPMAGAGTAPETGMTTTADPSDASAGWVDDLQLDRPVLAGQPARRRRWLRWLAVPVIAILVVGAVLWFANPFGTAAVSLVTAKATTGTIVSSVTISGSVASSTVDELSFGAAGTVTAVKVTPGAKVSAGQVLATIDDSALQVQLTTARANLTAAQARLALDRAGPTAATIAAARDAISQANLQLSTARQSLTDTYAQNRQSIAQANSAISTARATLATDEAAVPVDAARVQQDQVAVTNAEQALSAAQLKATLAVHQAESQVSSASLGVTTARHSYDLKVVPTTPAQIASDEAAVASAQQAVSTLQTTGATITAPMSGTVTAVNLVVGQQVSGSSASGSSSSSSSGTTSQIEIMDLSHLQVAGQASETDIPKLKMGQSATITATALGSETVVGTICSLSVVGTQISGVTSFGATVCLDGANPALLVGMSATAAVVTDRADNAVMVPSLAVKTVGGQQVVSVLGSDGKTQANVPVQVGISNGSQTQIVSGLSAGATVVETLQTTTPTRTGGGGRGFPVGGFGGG